MFAVQLHKRRFCSASAIVEHTDVFPIGCERETLCTENTIVVLTVIRHVLRAKLEFAKPAVSRMRIVNVRFARLIDVIANASLTCVKAQSFGLF